MTDIRFQQALWLYVILIALAAIAAIYPAHSTSLAAAYEAETAAWSASWQVISLLMAFIVAVIVGLVGLFKYKARGRSLSLYTTLAGLAISPFLGSSLSSGLETSLSEAATMLWGVILALSYFSPVSKRFAH